MIESGRSELRLWLTVLQPTSVLIVALFARLMRQWYFAQSIQAKEHIKIVLLKIWMPSLIIMLSTIVFFILNNLREVPITNRVCFRSFTINASQNIAEFQAEVMYRVYEDSIHSKSSLITSRVEKVVNNLAAANNELQKLVKRWQVYVIHRDFHNTFVFPSGHIFFFDGLMEFVKNEDQMAVVLGHEMAHVVLQHGFERLSMMSLFENIEVVCVFVLWLLVPSLKVASLLYFICSLCLDLFYYPLSRLHEREADKIGLMFASKACYDYREGSLLWKNFAESEVDTYTIPIFWRSHPRGTERAHFLASLEKNASVWRNENKSCPLLKV